MQTLVMRTQIRCGAAAALLLALSACSSSKSTESTGGNSAPCTVTITGAAAVAGTFKCVNAPTLGYAASNNLGFFGFTITGTPSIDGTVVFTGEPTAKTYANSTTVPSFGFNVNSGTATWEFTGGVQLNKLGSFSMTLTTVNLQASSATGNIYLVHGTLDATLVAGPGTTATGSITMHVTF